MTTRVRLHRRTCAFRRQDVGDHDRYLTLDLSIDSSDHRDVPRVTSWFLIIEPSYPLGLIKLYPAMNGGIKVTFPHQDHNGEKQGAPFRKGGLCLEAPSGLGADREPLDALHRLKWHVRRARQWLQAAATGTLRSAGDRFELPHWPNASTDVTVLFDQEIFKTATPNDIGLVELVEINKQEHVTVSAVDRVGKRVGQVSFGAYISQSGRQSNRHRGVWLRCTRLPIVPPWGAPETWNELKHALRQMGTDLDQVLELAARRDATMLMLGFPIPAIIGGPDEEVWWQALTLPKLRRRGKQSRRKCKRAKLQSPFAASDTDKILWITTESISKTRLGARSALGDTVARASISVIGAGALGSMVIDTLIRGGCERLHILDPETLCIGNLVRHTLDMRYLGRLKAATVANRANLLMPYATVSSNPILLPNSSELAHTELAPYDIIIDCTASNLTLRALAQVSFTAPKLFVSASVGRNAQRLFFFAAYGIRFPLNDFNRELAPWLESEKSGSDRVWEGAGCWHPVSRARIDRLMVAAATSVRLLIEVRPTLNQAELVVFEHVESDSGYVGFQRRTAP